MPTWTRFELWFLLTVIVAVLVATTVVARNAYWVDVSTVPLLADSDSSPRSECDKSGPSQCCAKCLNVFASASTAAHQYWSRAASGRALSGLGALLAAIAGGAGILLVLRVRRRLWPPAVLIVAPTGGGLLLALLIIATVERSGLAGTPSPLRVAAARLQELQADHLWQTGSACDRCVQDVAEGRRDAGGLTGYAGLAGKFPNVGPPEGSSVDWAKERCDDVRKAMNRTVTAASGVPEHPPSTEGAIYDQNTEFSNAAQEYVGNRLFGPFLFGLFHANFWGIGIWLQGLVTALAGGAAMGVAIYLFGHRRHAARLRAEAS